jgi:hypothetical protein
VLDPADAPAAKANPGSRRRQQGLTLGADLQPALLHAPRRPRQHHGRRRELLQQRSTCPGCSEACRRVFAGDDFLTVAYARHGARDGTAPAQA